jgi:hypothetical protein
VSAQLRREVAALARRVEARRAAGSVEVLDPVALARACAIEPDPWQADVLRSTAPRLLLNCCRQAGKSTVSALLGLHVALAQPGALVLIVSPAERQSRLLFKKLVGLHRRLGEPVAAAVENRLSLELRNGSEVHALPGAEQTIRGFSAVSLLLADEAARIADETIAACRPMLAVSGGRLVAMSTPWGQRGWFWEAWERGGDDWQRFMVPASVCPRISAEFLQAERRAMSPLRYRSEYCCEFVDTEDQLFASELVLSALSAEIEPWRDLPPLPNSFRGNDPLSANDLGIPASEVAAAVDPGTGLRGRGNDDG